MLLPTPMNSNHVQAVLKRMSWNTARGHMLSFSGVLELAFRLPNNKRLQRRFRRSDTVSKVAAFLGQSSIDMQQHVIIRSFPRKVSAFMSFVVKSACQAGLLYEATVGKSSVSTFMSRTPFPLQPREPYVISNQAPFHPRGNKST